NKYTFDENALNNEREQELLYLTQVIGIHKQPVNVDDLVSILMDDFSDILDTSTVADGDNINNNQQVNQNETEVSSSSVIPISTQNAYPPINQIGIVKDHDRPYASYGHLDRQTIAQECKFNLQTSAPVSLNTADEPSEIR